MTKIQHFYCNSVSIWKMWWTVYSIETKIIRHSSLWGLQGIILYTQNNKISVKLFKSTEMNNAGNTTQSWEVFTFGVLCFVLHRVLERHSRVLSFSYQEWITYREYVCGSYWEDNLVQARKAHRQALLDILFTKRRRAFPFTQSAQPSNQISTTLLPNQ